MEKLKSSLAAKIAAVVLIIVSLAITVAGFAGMAMMDAVGGYQIHKDDMLKKAYEEACTNYSVAAMAGYLEQYDADELMQTNFRYGIVKADNLSEVDFADRNSYIIDNLDVLPHTREMHFEEYDITEDSWFDLKGNSIFDAYCTYHSTEYSDLAYSVDGWLYDLKTETFYVQSEDGLFPITDQEGEMILTDNGETFPLNSIRTLMSEETTQNGTFYAWKDHAQISFYRYSAEVNVKDIEIVDGIDKVLEDYGEVQKQSPEYFEGSEFYVRHKNKSDHYIIASYVNEPLEGEQSFAQGDMFVQSKLLIDFAYRMRYVGIVMAAVSLIVLLAAFSFLMASAGHRKGTAGVCPMFMDYVPLDLYAAGVFLAELAVTAIGIYGVELAVSWVRNSFSGIVTSAVIVVCAAVFAVLIGIAFCMSFAVRVKMGKWWRHTITYIITKKCMQIFVKGIRFCAYLVASLCRSVTLLWKAWILLGFLAFIEFVAIQMSWADARLTMLWFMEKIVVYPVIILALMQMNRLQKGARQIANGQLDYKINTKNMFWEIRKHGEYLNDIGHGINCAVNERMKSEHFKTELITNVSHDIKTPLTSIINYVDLLQKEEIDNPTVQEYLEVLHRQSARLKKLIEDLMEASKASTGSLNVVMEKCDAGVMLIQTIGEFEEKLMAEQIELQIKKPEADIFIEADHRHLWRVFDNLMNNICKYAQPSTRAYVNLEENGQYAVIIFRNISRYQLNISSEELMERFVRGDSSRNTEGSGLGISIAKSLTELMEGTFELTVDGDLFKVALTFPLYGVEKVQEKQQEQKANFVQNAGSYAAEFGQGMANKTGRIFRRAGKYAHHVHQAIQQVKAEEAEQMEAEGPLHQAEKKEMS